MRHLHENFHKKFKHPDLQKLLWKAAQAITREDFDDALAKMTINDKAVPWLLNEAKPEYWVELYFRGNHWGHFMSNIAESLNKWILIAREQPILAMFETIRHQLMDWFTARRQQDAGNTQSILVQNIANQIQTLLNDRTRRY